MLHLLAGSLALVFPPVQPQDGARAPRVERGLAALFLGDDGHHRPRELHALLASSPLLRGIHLDYAEGAETLTPERLAPYAALLVYANIDELPAPGERALLDFVEEGHGLVALHCASYCFRNSEAWIALVGAQFERHGTGVFSPLTPSGEHPLMRGLLGWTSFDETYVHRLHASDREILSWRVDSEGREPWTWTRSQGRGRVFYCASGHDERTWQEPGYQELVARALRWTSRDASFQEPPPLPALARQNASVPDYRADGGQGRLESMQAPLSPADSRAYHAVPPGYELALWASEPDLGPTLALCWDERGRAFLLESHDYPNERIDEGGHDRIRIAEDSDGDGRADRFGTFAAGLSIPTGIVRAGKAWIVAQAPEMLALYDHDGDDEADERRELFRGFGTGDTHAGPSNLRLGFDGWIWGTVGYSGFDGEVGGVRHRFGQGVFRFLPDGSRLEFLGSTSNNTWGLGFDELGTAFVSTANNDQINLLGIPNRSYERMAGATGRAVRFIGEYRELHPLLEHIRQVDWHGRFTAAAGCAPYTARVFPSRYWNRVAWIAEPTAHLVAESLLEPRGAGFVARDGGSVFASRDEWSAPVAAEVGPDGALWILDWYHYIVQHNPTPLGYTTGKGNAYETPLRRSERSRIWRVWPSAAKLDPLPRLVAVGNKELVALLDHPNLLWRMRTQDQIVSERRLDLVPALVARAQRVRLDEIGNDPGALHALCCLAGLSFFESPKVEAWEVLQKALVHPAPALRRRALDLLPRSEAGAEALLESRALLDEDAGVRKQALLAVAEMPARAAFASFVLDRLQQGDELSLPWLSDALLLAGAANDAAILQAVPQRFEGQAESEAAAVGPRNLLPNPDCEAADARAADRPAAWRVRTYSGRAEHAWVAEGRGGGRCLAIESEEGADTSWYVDVPVRPRSRYRLSAWIRVEGLAPVGDALGALLNVHASPTPTVTRGLRGSGDWERVELVFDSGERESVSLNCLFGGWGHARGRALYDDLELVLEPGGGFAGLEAPLAGFLSRLTRHYAHRAPRESLPRLLEALAQGTPAIAQAVLDGLLQGWPDDRPLDLGERGQELFGRLLARASPAEAAELLAAAKRHGLALSPATRPVLDALAAELSDPEADPDARVAAARNLMRLADSADSLGRILDQLDARATPELCSGLIQSLEESRRDELAGELLERWGDLPPSARGKALVLLRRRAAWTVGLLDAVAEDRVGRGELSAVDWSQLASSPVAAVRERAVELGQRPPGERSERVARALERLKPALELPGDAERGRALYTRLCSTCHHLGNEGGDVGPALDGIGVRPRVDLLGEILDPNRSVEATYQMWVVETSGGEILSGRLTNESRTTIELLASDGRRRTLERDEIEVLRASGVSLMPEGLLDELAPQAVADLLEAIAPLHR